MIRLRRPPLGTLTLAAAILALGSIALLAAVAHALPTEQVAYRLAMGARSLLIVVVPAVAISLLVGIPLGLVAARVGRLGDRLVTRVLEVLGGFPSIVMVALLRATAPDAPFWIVAATLALVRVPETVRLVRLHTVRYRASELYMAERALGASPARVLFRHTLPMMAGSLASTAVMGLGVLVGVEAAMTFLGLGAASQGPTWGGELGRALALGNPQGAIAPALALALTIVASYRLAEGVQSWFSPCISRP